MHADDSKPHSSETVLVAEDDFLIRELVAGYLAQMGFEVLEAENGREAAKIIQTHPATIDLIVTDLLMPHLSGKAIIEQALQNGICERFLIMSGNPLSATEKDPDDTTNSRYLEKPFTFSQFTKELNQLLEHSA